MDHYTNLIIKGLMNGGGSTSETNVQILLRGDFEAIKKHNHSVTITEMWQRFEPELQQRMIELLRENDAYVSEDTEFPFYFVERMARFEAYRKLNNELANGNRDFDLDKCEADLRAEIFEYYK